MKNIKNRYDDFFDDEDSIKEKRQKPKLNGDFECEEELSLRKKQTSFHHRKGDKRKKRKF